MFFPFKRYKNVIEGAVRVPKVVRLGDLYNWGAGQESGDRGKGMEARAQRPGSPRPSGCLA